MHNKDRCSQQDGLVPLHQLLQVWKASLPDIEQLLHEKAEKMNLQHEEQLEEAAILKTEDDSDACFKEIVDFIEDVLLDYNTCYLHIILPSQSLSDFSSLQVSQIPGTSPGKESNAKKRHHVLDLLSSESRDLDISRKLDKIASHFGILHDSSANETSFSRTVRLTGFIPLHKLERLCFIKQKAEEIFYLIMSEFKVSPSLGFGHSKVVATAAAKNNLPLDLTFNEGCQHRAYIGRVLAKLDLRDLTGIKENTVRELSAVITNFNMNDVRQRLKQIYDFYAANNLRGFHYLACLAFGVDPLPLKLWQAAGIRSFSKPPEEEILKKIIQPGVELIVRNKKEWIQVCCKFSEKNVNTLAIQRGLEHSQQALLDVVLDHHLSPEHVSLLAYKDQKCIAETSSSLSLLFPSDFRFLLPSLIQKASDTLINNDKADITALVVRARCRPVQNKIVRLMPVTSNSPDDLRLAFSVQTLSAPEEIPIAIETLVPCAVESLAFKVEQEKLEEKKERSRSQEKRSERKKSAELRKQLVCSFCNETLSPILTKKELREHVLYCIAKQTSQDCSDNDQDLPARVSDDLKMALSRRVKREPLFVKIEYR